MMMNLKGIIFALIISLIVLPVPQAYGGEAGCGCACGDVISPPCSDRACINHMCSTHGTYCSSGSSGGGGGDGSEGFEALGYFIGESLFKGVGAGIKGIGSLFGGGKKKRRKIRRPPVERMKPLKSDPNKETLSPSTSQQILGGLKAPGSGSLSIRGGDGSFETLNFQDYVDSESRRRETLKGLKEDVDSGQRDKKVLDWCKLHKPLRPTRPISQSVDSTFAEKMGDYRRREFLWLSRCQGSGLAANPTPQPSKAKKLPPPPGPKKPTCADCSLNRTQTHTGCDAQYDQDLSASRYHDCVQKGNEEAERCKHNLKCSGAQ